jgi:hypothetical protein
MEALGLPIQDLEKAFTRWDTSMQVIAKNMSAEFKSWTEETPLELRKTHVETLMQKYSEAVGAFIKVVSTPLIRFKKQILLLGASGMYLGKFLRVLQRGCILSREGPESAVRSLIEVRERVCMCVFPCYCGS